MRRSLLSARGPIHTGGRRWRRRPWSWMSYQPYQHERKKREMWKMRSYFCILPAVVSSYLSLLIYLEPHTIWLVTIKQRHLTTSDHRDKQPFYDVMIKWTQRAHKSSAGLKKTRMEQLEQVMIWSGLQVCACKDNNSKLGRVAHVWIPSPPLSDVFPLDLFQFMPHLALFLLL